MVESSLSTLKLRNMSIRHSIFCLFISLFFSFAVNGQNISIQVLDARTKGPVSDAFVFIQNSSIGTSSNQDGLAILDTRSLDDFELIITHISYENLVVPSSQLSVGINQVLLQESPQDLGAVVLAAKKKNARNRKRWMKQFQTTFFGENVRKKDIEFLNSEVLWFEVSDSLFEARAIDNLRFINKKTGYELQFVLEHFSIDAREDVRYRGKLFFKDIKDQYRHTRKIEGRRKQYYLQSKQLFFLSLVNRLPTQLERYEFGITQADSIKTYRYTPLSYEDLNWKRGEIGDTLLLKDFLTVLKKGNIQRKTIAKKGGIRRQVERTATSFLRSKSGKFIINQNGQLLNPADIEESGYWSNYRMATQLPIDYEAAIQLKPQKSTSPVLDSLLQYRYRRPPEKTYLHLNQTVFSNRENLWFKAYLVDGIDHLPQTTSEVLYVDLISPADDIIYTWHLHRQIGFSGDYQWTPSHAPGTYRLRAYTNYMRNMDPDFFFERSIELRDYLQEEIAIPKTTSAPSSPLLDFFPEGGDLIANTPANLVILLRDSDLHPIQLEGQIINKNRQLITTGKTNHLGAGLLSFAPQINQKYYYQFVLAGKEYQFPLPVIYPEGLRLHVNPVDDENIYLKVGASQKALLDKAFLVGHVRGAIFLQTDQLEDGKTIQLSKSDIPAGLLHFTLFDTQQRPQAERLVFNDYGLEAEDIRARDTSFTFEANQRYSLPLQLDSNLLKSSINLSVSITNNTLVPFDKYQENIQSYFLLNSDLSQAIPQASHYLQNITNRKRYYLDLLLQCLTWRRFSWRSLLAEKPRNHSFEVEKGYTIAGYTTRKEDTTRIQTQIMINSLEKDLVYQQLQTDEKGEFSFTQLPFKDSTTFIIQGRIGSKEKQSEGVVIGNRLVDIHISPLSKAELNPPRKWLCQISRKQLRNSSLNLDQLREKAMSDQENNPAGWTIELDELNIQAKRINLNSRLTRGAKFYNLDQTDWIAPKAQGIRILGNLVPGAMFQTDGIRLLRIITNTQGQIEKIPVYIEINGMGNRGTFDASRFLSLRADDIQTIYVNGPYINVITRSIPRSRAAYLDSGILQYEHPGYHRAREFYSPSYPTNGSQDLRTTIQWIPFLPLDKATKEINIPFRTGGIPTPYHVRVEGLSSNGKVIHFSQPINWK